MIGTEEAIPVEEERERSRSQESARKQATLDKGKGVSGKRSLLATLQAASSVFGASLSSQLAVAGATPGIDGRSQSQSVRCVGGLAVKDEPPSDEEMRGNPVDVQTHQHVQKHIGKLADDIVRKLGYATRDLKKIFFSISVTQERILKLTAESAELAK